MSKDSLYEVLGLSQKASSDEIKKAYMRLAKTHHPDRGGDAEKFKKINHAYEILSDDGKRQMYDMTGQEGDEPNSGGGGNPFDEMFHGGGFPGMNFDMGNIFGQFMGGGMPRQPQKQGKGPSKHHEIGLSLFEFFHGRDIRIVFSQGRFCHACKGEGALSFETCNKCNGRGTQVQHIQIGPMAFMQSTGPCQPCSGRGKQPVAACTVCSGNKILVREKALEYKIHPGRRENENIVFTGECSDSPEYHQPGDVVLKLKRSDDLPYAWTGNNLELDIKITWLESISGWYRILTDHPRDNNGKTTAIKWNGGILVNGMRIIGHGLGMPYEGGKKTGNLIICIHIDPPNALDDNLKKDIVSALYASSDDKPIDATSTVVLSRE